MKKLAILGMGHIGSYVHSKLLSNKSFSVSCYDLSMGHDLSDAKLVESVVKNHDGVLVSTPFYLNKQIATLCNEHGCDYFDLTESVEVTDYVKTLKNATFVTQCGLAPGIVSIIAHNLATKLQQVDSIQIRVGALPKNANNHLGYYRTWNTAGLINEYINPCPAIVNYEKTNLEPVADFEEVMFNGMLLEAANTSGGLGSLADTWAEKAKSVNYKTLRYPGHWKLIQFLKEDLGLKNNFSTYVKLFDENVPKTSDDYVFILINVSGYLHGEYKVLQYDKMIDGTENHTAIQVATGNGVLSILDGWDLGLRCLSQKGWVKQEDIPLSSIWSSVYYNCYKK